jgi:F-type H+-transporting ATPase subunit epsilon
MSKTFTLEIHTPMRFFLTAETEELVVALVDGECGILANHGRFTSPIVPCIVRMKQPDGAWKEAFVDAGIIEVKKHKTVILAQDAAWPSEIDIALAKQARDETELKLTADLSTPERDELKTKLQTAELRLKLGKKRG